MPAIYPPQGETNKTACSGCHRCYCGAKYWENDICISCGLAHNPDNYFQPEDEPDSDRLIGRDDPEVNPYLRVPERAQRAHREAVQALEERIQTLEGELLAALREASLLRGRLATEGDNPWRNIEDIPW